MFHRFNRPVIAILFGALMISSLTAQETKMKANPEAKAAKRKKDAKARAASLRQIAD
jgi:hypothetical protein